LLIATNTFAIEQQILHRERRVLIVNIEQSRARALKRAAAFQRRHGGAIASPVGESFSTMPGPASVTADQSEEVRRAEMGAAGRQRPDADILDDDYDPEME
jgi:hypothetical protein